MFDNIGRKIKNIAIGVFVVEIISGISIGLSIGIKTEWDNAFWAIVVIISSPFAAWVSSVLLYGFGQLIENSDMLVVNSKKLVDKTTNQTKISQNPVDRFLSKPNNSTDNSTHRWRCTNCGNMVSENLCPYCNQNSN